MYRIVSSVQNGLDNVADPDYYKTSPSGRLIPIWNYSPNGLIPRFYELRKIAFEFDTLELAKLTNLSAEYDFLFIGIPANEGDATIQWKQTYRDQFTVPEGSLLLAISGCAG